MAPKARPVEECRLVRSDMPVKQRKPVKDAVQLFYNKNVKTGDAKRPKPAMWGDFALELKQSLDGNLGPHWHVLVGTQLGFACKKRNQTMAVVRIQECMVVLWQSPGIEEWAPGDDAPPTDGKQEAADDAAGDAAPADSPASVALKVLEPSTVEAGSDHERIIAVLKEEFCGTKGDTQELAQTVRRRLTAELGTIWHVVTGTEFVAEVAEDRRNYVLAQAGKWRIVCFQHEQFGKNRIDLERLFKALPYLLLALFCFAYMTLNSICMEEPSPDRPFALRMSKKLCVGDWESKVNYIGMAALGTLFMSRKGAIFNRGKKQKAE